MAAGKTTAADLGAWICFADETGQGLRPPKAHTWAPRGVRPIVQVRGRSTGRVNVAGVIRIIKRKLKKIQSRPHLLGGCLAASGLVIEPW